MGAKRLAENRAGVLASGFVLLHSVASAKPIVRADSGPTPGHLRATSPTV